MPEFLLQLTLSAIQGLVLEFLTELELHDGGLEGRFGVEAVFFALLGEEDSWVDLHSHFAEYHADTCRARKSIMHYDR
jgi:hypothetical protein